MSDNIEFTYNESVRDLVLRRNNCQTEKVS